MEIFFTILIMTLVVSLSGVFTRVLPFQLPLPLMQIAIGALLAWPTFGLHVEFDPELFLVLFIPPLLFADGWKTPTREFLEHGREIFGDTTYPSLCAGRRPFANRCCCPFRHCGGGAHTEENHGHPAGRSVDERRLRSGLSEVCRRRSDGDDGIYRWWRNA